MSNPVITIDLPDPRTPAIERGLLSQRMFRFLVDVVRRLGGQRADFVQEARNSAKESEALVRALVQGAISNYALLTPASGLLTATATSSSLATISVAQHTRAGAAATIQAGSITGVSRGTTYYVYYSDAGNAGGSVTFLATTSLTTLSAAGVRLVGAIHVEAPPPSSGGVG